MPNIRVLLSQSHLYKEISSIKNALVFVFTSLGSVEPYLSDLLNRLKDASSEPLGWDPESEQWYSSKELRRATAESARLFGEFAEANQADSNVVFLAIGLTNENHKGSTIYRYENGIQVSDDFKLPSKPGKVTVIKVRHDTVDLQFSAPSEGAQSITGYRADYRVKGQKEWNQQPQAEARGVTPTGLSANTEYEIKVRAVTAVGVGPAAEGDFKTKPCSPPRDLKAEADSTDITLSWNKPEDVGLDVKILSYIVRYRREEQVRWDEQQADSEKAVISELQPQTSYIVRVLCNCGANGKSKKSPKVTIITTPPSLALC